MDVRTFLLTGGSFSIKGCPVKNFYTGRYDKPESITAMDANVLIGLDTKDGFVKMSMETWRRLELFISILQKVGFTYLEKDVLEVLGMFRSITDGKELQQKMAGTSQGKMASTESDTARKNSKTGLLPDVPVAFSGAEIAGAPP